jgi:hypothetical protein
VPTPKEQCEQLLDAAFPLAERLLVEHGEIVPFGATLAETGKIAIVAVSEGAERVESQPMIDSLRRQLRISASMGEVVATAVTSDVRVVPPGKRDKTDAVQVELDHRDDYSVIVYLPYVLSKGAVTFGEIFASYGEKRIFANGD